jgi:hypothetical protein
MTITLEKALREALIKFAESCPESRLEAVLLAVISAACSPSSSDNFVEPNHQRKRESGQPGPHLVDADG